jgi:hypothetical protein
MMDRTLRKITEEEVFAIAGDNECPVLSKEEAAEMEAAVCLKRFPDGYVLGISDKVRDLHLWFTADPVVAEEQYQRYVQVMRQSGTPFGTPGCALEHRANGKADPARITENLTMGRP